MYFEPVLPRHRVTRSTRSKVLCVFFFFLISIGVKSPYPLAWQSQIMFKDIVARWYRKEMFDSQLVFSMPNNLSNLHFLCMGITPLCCLCVFVCVRSSIAVESHSLLEQQGRTFRTNISQLDAITKKYPIINDVVGRIRRVHKRDRIVIAATLAICITVLLLFWWNSWTCWAIRFSVHPFFTRRNYRALPCVYRDIHTRHDQQCRSQGLHQRGRTVIPAIKIRCVGLG